VIEAKYSIDAAMFARECLDFPVDAQQQQVLEIGPTRGILNCSRQWGKSTTMAIKAVHRAYFVPKSQVLVIAPTERQSGELVAKAREFLRMVGVKPRGDGRNAISILLPNGSRIVGLPNVEKNIRGFTASMLLVDEAARVPDDLYDAVRPMLAVSQGELWLMSTPDGKRGFFYEEWTNGTEPWVRIAAKATECSRYPKEFLEIERRRNEAKFRQEYLCEFVFQEDALFDEAVVRRSSSDDVAPFVPRGERRW
jgi:hypothetical protein